MDQGDLATRLSGINLSPPAASSTQGECGDVVRQSIKVEECLADLAATEKLRRNRHDKKC